MVEQRGTAPRSDPCVDLYQRLLDIYKLFCGNVNQIKFLIIFSDLNDTAIR